MKAFLKIVYWIGFTISYLWFELNWEFIKYAGKYKIYKHRFRNLTKVI